MAKAGKALREVLGKYGITQNRLAVAMGINRSTINTWVNESNDPSSTSILEIRKGLEAIDPDAAEEFIRLYLED